MTATTTRPKRGSRVRTRHSPWVDKAKDKTVLKVLEVVNPIRKAFGKEPLVDLKRGHRGKAQYCPIQRSVGREIRVGGSTFDVPALVWNRVKKQLDEAEIPYEERGDGSWAYVTFDDSYGAALDDFVGAFDDGEERYQRYVLE